MSFAEQERALFDLIFEQPLRERFCENGLSALADYDLTETECADFDTIRPEALSLDAKMRINLILARFCRELPLSFGLVSSINNGRELLESLVDSRTMKTPPHERVNLFASRLRDSLSSGGFFPAQEQMLVMALIETELGMAWTASSLKAALLSGNGPAEGEISADEVQDSPVCLAEYVSASVIPAPYAKLRKMLCPCELDQLWKHLCDNPLSSAQCSMALQHNDPRLLLMRADIRQMSHCSPETKHVTVELSEGFAPLLQHLDGSNSINSLLLQFGQAGAPEALLQSVRNGFLQLLKSGMLMEV